MTKPIPHTTRIGIVGHGAFGQLMAHHLAQHCQLVIHDRKPAACPAHSRLRPAASMDVISACEIIILAVPVQQLEAVCKALAPRLRPRCLVLDVSSVKGQACSIMARCLPPGVRILGSHPLFGPQSAAAGVAGLKIVLCPARRGPIRAVKRFCEEALGLRVIIATPDEHDRQMAISQALTHYLAAVLRHFSMPDEMTTVSFDLLKRAAQMVASDSLELLEAIESWNPHSQAVRKHFLAQARLIDAHLEGMAQSASRSAGPG